MHKVILLKELLLEFKIWRQSILAARELWERNVICLL